MLKETYKKLIVLIFIFVVLFSVSFVSAEANHSTLDQIQKIDLSDATGCTSVIVRDSDTHYVLAFRRDANYSANIYIQPMDWHGFNVIEQFKNESGYAFHVVLTQNGWLISNGGHEDSDDNQRIEAIAANMVSNNTIDNESLKNISTIKTKNNNTGHFFIMNPQGNYAVVFANNSIYSEKAIDNGKYLCIPNDESYFASGNYKTRGPDAVEAAVSIISKDNYGVDRRDVIIYDITFDEDKEITNVDVYASNDDGSFSGVSAGNMVDDIVINDTVIKGMSLLHTPRMTHLGVVPFDSMASSGSFKYLFS